MFYWVMIFTVLYDYNMLSETFQLQHIKFLISYIIKWIKKAGHASPGEWIKHIQNQFVTRQE